MEAVGGGPPKVRAPEGGGCGPGGIGASEAGGWGLPEARLWAWGWGPPEGRLPKAGGWAWRYRGLPEAGFSQGWRLRACGWVGILYPCALLGLYIQGAPGEGR